jgi:hypothetical protein
LDKLEREAKATRKEILHVCWYMRGGVTYAEAMDLSVSERTIINDIIKENLETTKKSGMPFF